MCKDCLVWTYFANQISFQKETLFFNGKTLIIYSLQILWLEEPKNTGTNNSSVREIIFQRNKFETETTEKNI